MTYTTVSASGYVGSGGYTLYGSGGYYYNGEYYATGYYIGMYIINTQDILDITRLDTTFPVTILQDIIRLGTIRVTPGTPVTIPSVILQLPMV
jgi:hypothetical protein